MDNKNNKIKFLIFTIVWVLLLGLGMTGIIMLVLNDMISFPVFAGMVVLFIVIWFVIIHVVSRHFELDTFPDPLTKKNEEASFEAHVSLMDRPREGKDMYEILDNVSKKARKGRIISASAASIGIAILLILMLIDSKETSVPLIICAILVAGTFITIVMAMGFYHDYGFTPADKLDAAIIKQGFDPDDVNRDFMNATYHDLNLGLMAVGNTYYVVYSPGEFRVCKLVNITKAEHYSCCIHVSKGWYDPSHFIRIHENDNTHRDYRCLDKLTAELLLNRFLIENIKTETFPTNRMAPKTESVKAN